MSGSGCPDPPPADVAASANDRRNQENLHERLKNGVKAPRTPVDNLVSNWAHMVMASLAWTLKAWFALLPPTKGRGKDQPRSEKQRVLKMEFKTFLNAFLRPPRQLIRSGRRITFRLLAWNPWLGIFFRAVHALRHPRRCGAGCPMSGSGRPDPPLAFAAKVR